MVTEVKLYSVPDGARAALQQLLNDKRLAIPDEVKAAAENVHYEGSDVPFLCVPVKMADAMAGVRGLEAAFASAIAKSRGIDAGHATINTDQAGLSVFSAILTQLNGEPATGPAHEELFKSAAPRFLKLATNVYKTKDGFFHLHGSLNPLPSMTMVGVEKRIPEFKDEKDEDTLLAVYADAVKDWTSAEIDRTANEEYRQAGTICYAPDDFLKLEQGQAIGNCPIYELSSRGDSAPVPWPQATENKALSGIKVLELTRIIAAPAIGKGLAEHGATVLRVTSSKLPDMAVLHPDLSQGKRVCDLDLKSEDGKATLRELVKEADVFIDGYRPGAVERLGFGRDEIRKLNPNLVYVRENCYGWHGPWQGRSGWQQISDCLTGVSHTFGKFLGLGDEPVVPIFPNSDYGTGAAGLVGVMHALYLRNKVGGVYDLDTSLSYYNLYLLSLGTYPDAVWEVVRPSAPLRHNWDMGRSLPAVIPEMAQRRPDVFGNKAFWQVLDAPKFGGKVTTLASTVRFESLDVQVGRGPVPNGADPATWE